MEELVETFNFYLSYFDNLNPNDFAIYLRNSLIRKRRLIPINQFEGIDKLEQKFKKIKKYQKAEYKLLADFMKQQLEDYENHKIKQLMKLKDIYEDKIHYDDDDRVEAENKSKIIIQQCDLVRNTFGNNKLLTFNI